MTQQPRNILNPISIVLPYLYARKFAFYTLFVTRPYAVLGVSKRLQFYCHFAELHTLRLCIRIRITIRIYQVDKVCIYKQS